MRVVYMAKNKKSSVEALEFLINNDIEVACVVCESKKNTSFSKYRVIDTAEKYNIPVVKDTDIYDSLNGNKELENVCLDDIDLVISFLFWKKIKKPIINLAKKGCINFHPAPLPDYRGVGGYNFAIYDEIDYWGVSAHFVDEEFDTGNIITVNKFDIIPGQETAYSLEQKTQMFLLDLFKYIINLVESDAELDSYPQGDGRYINFEEFSELRKIKKEDSLYDINKKIRSFWYPPYHGATIEIKGQKFTLINNDILKKIGKIYHSK